MKLEIRRRIVLSLLPWLQLLKAGPQEDVVLLLGVVELVALAPIIGHSVGKDLSVLVECRLGDGLLTRLARLQLGASVLVPEGEAAVGADGGEGAVHWVEGDVVHGKDILIEKGRVNKSDGQKCIITWNPFTAPVLRWHLKVKLSFGLTAFTYWIATRPSTLPNAKPVGAFFLSLKMDTQRC